MHPTVEEQLAAVRRLVEEAATDPGIGTGAAGALALAASQLRRLERSVGARLPFLLADDERSLELLAEVGALVPRLAPSIERGVAAAPPTVEVSEPAAHERNKALRSLLAAVVHELGDGDDPPVATARRAIAAHLRARLAADPALNRTPVPMPAPGT